MQTVMRRIGSTQMVEVPDRAVGSNAPGGMPEQVGDGIEIQLTGVLPVLTEIVADVLAVRSHGRYQ